MIDFKYLKHGGGQKNLAAFPASTLDQIDGFIFKSICSEKTCQIFRNIFGASQEQEIFGGRFDFKISALVLTLGSNRTFQATA